MSVQRATQKDVIPIIFYNSYIFQHSARLIQYLLQPIIFD